MAFVYDLSASTLPKTLLKSQAATLFGERGAPDGDAAVEREIVAMIRAARAPKAVVVGRGGDGNGDGEGGAQGKDRETAGQSGTSVEDDIFPGAGEYVFEPCLAGEESRETGVGAGAARTRTIFGTPSEAGVAPVVPRSIENLVGRMHPESFHGGSLPGGGVENTEDYAECYPGILEAPGIGLESDGEEGDDGRKRGRRPEEGGGQESRRRQAMKSKQKLEKQVAKVSKIMQEKYRDANKEG